MKSDLISREALKKAIEKYRNLNCVSTSTIIGVRNVMYLIDNAPTVEPERPQGEWIKWNFKTFGAFGDWEYRCSKCEKVYGGEYNFCPNCGADMRKGNKK